MIICRTICKVGLLAILAGCSSETTSNKIVNNKQESVKQLSRADITNFLTTQTETFEINQKKDTLIYCQKGTVIFLPANCLQFKDGTLSVKPVKFEVKECNSLKDYLGENLSTVSDSNLLETAGMINIKATVDGKEVILKKEKEYAIYFPKSKKEKEMNLFYGNRNIDGQMNWTLKPDTKIKESANVPSESNFKDTSLLKSTIEICGNSVSIGSNQIEWKMKDGNLSVFDYFKDNFKSPEKNINDFPYSIVGIEMKIIFDFMGKVNNIKFEKPYPKENTKIVTDFLYSMPPINTSSMGVFSIDREYTLRFCKKTSFDYDKFNTQFKRKYSSFKDKAISKIDKSELNYYVFTATKFDWINCDKFLNTSDEKTSFCVTADHSNETTIKIVFSDFNSIMDGIASGNKFIFNNVPINAKIKIIGISYNNAKPTMCIAQTTVDRTGYNLTAFKEFTLGELEAELNIIN